MNANPPNPYEQAARLVLTGCGELLAREGVRATPVRFAKAMEELLSGYKEDPSEWMGGVFDAEGTDQMVCQWHIPLYSLCEHHLLTISGYAHIGYIPREKILGLSKFKRVVDMYSRRLQVQERMTKQIATFLDEQLDPRGVIVVIEAEHMCMTARGVQTPGTLTTTSAVTGDFLDPTQGSREEFMSLLNRTRRDR